MPALITGLGGVAGFGEGVLPPRDDFTAGIIDLSPVFGGGGLYFNGTHYTSAFVQTNGNVTLGLPWQNPQGSAFGSIPGNPMIIAPFWMDLDTRGPHHVSPGGASQGTNAVYFDLDTQAKVFTVTWDDVGYSPTQNDNPVAFQMQLISAGAPGDFDIAFIYEYAGPAAADQPNVAWAGWSLGHMPGGATTFQIAGSGDAGQMAQVDTAPGNTGVPGYWIWHIRGGVMVADTPGPTTGPPDPPPPDPDPDPDPTPDPVIPDPGDEDAKDPVKAPHSVSFGLEASGLVREGDTGATPYSVTILRTGDDLGSPSVVSWEIVIDDPNDLVPGQLLSGTAVFGVGEKAVIIPVAVQGDKVFEQDEMFEFKLTNAVHGDQTFNPNVSAFGVIVNDDAPVTFDFSGPQVRAEGLAGLTPFDFVVLRTGDLTLASTVTWALSPGTADSLDFAPDQPLTGTVTFAPGATQAVIQIQVAGDLKAEPDETFTLRLTEAHTGAAVSMPNVSTTGTILDDDVRHALLVATPSALVVPEGNAGTTAFAYTLLRTGDLSVSVQIPYAIGLSAGGVSAGEIASPLSGFVTFAAGASEAMLTVLINGDSTPEDNESFLVTLGGGDFNNLTLTGVVMNDDQGPGGASVASTGVGAPVDMGGEASSFMQHLTGGGLWAGDGGL